MFHLGFSSFCHYFLIWLICFCVYHFNNFTHVFFVFCYVCFVCHTSSLAHTSSCPMVSTTTALKILPTCIAMVAVWAQAPAPPSPSSLFHLHPPPPHPVPPVHGHVLPQPCYQTTLPTVLWAPWSLHHESRAGRFVPSPGSWWSFPPPPLGRPCELDGYWHCFLCRTGPSQGPTTNLWSTHWGGRRTKTLRLYLTLTVAWMTAASPWPWHKSPLHCKHPCQWRKETKLWFHL